MTFDISAVKVDSDLWGVSFNADAPHYFTDAEWQAFRSLLMPNSRADFRLKEWEYRFSGRSEEWDGQES